MNYYDNNADTLSERYLALAPDDVHATWAESVLAGKNPGLACDIGAGSGRDANWLAEKGWEVIAVEPSRGMRERGRQRSHPRVSWLDDRLPGLKRLRSLGHRFDLILVSAVWMHLAPGTRERAFRVLSDCLRPGGTLVITLRHGNDEVENRERGFHAVSAEELLALARRRALVLTQRSLDADKVREALEWETLVFTLPDDGTGSLPLLRHIIVNDDKAASYKLGLLRVLTRLAEGASGLASQPDEDWVEIPLGAVGLFWIKQYKALLLDHRLRQHPARRVGYGFAKDAFYGLGQVSGYDLRVGAGISGDRAKLVNQAIADACLNITAMPVRYITWPGQRDPVFDFDRQRRPRIGDHLLITPEYLASFGRLRIPARIWQTLGQYACWLEPAILHEWRDMNMAWNVGEPHAADFGVFAWEEGHRDTRIAWDRYSDLKESGRQIQCTWTGQRIRRANMDHCFPWARWFNNDLWNLLPTGASVNREKRDRLPAAQVLRDAESRLLGWWEEAYLESPYQERFWLEARTSLPLVTEASSLTDLFGAVQLQRARLKADQQLAEWTLNQ